MRAQEGRASMNKTNEICARAKSRCAAYATKPEPYPPMRRESMAGAARRQKCAGSRKAAQPNANRSDAAARVMVREKQAAKNAGRQKIDMVASTTRGGVTQPRRNHTALYGKAMASRYVARSTAPAQCSAMRTRKPEPRCRTLMAANPKASRASSGARTHANRLRRLFMNRTMFIHAPARYGKP